MPSLNRIILIDTHMKGVVELCLKGHTNICGTNASGKTTLQRLVPVFYGEYPSRVVPATRDSFERWYLPRDSSFIIYEYERDEGRMNQAVLASAGDGKGVNYRLIAKTFELEDYVLEQEGKQFKCRTMAELGRAMKRDGIPHTTLLNTREYRAIIQNDRSLITTGSNSAELRGYARQFSLCASGHSLRHIEKLAKAVHSKEGKMETIKSMIAAILEEEGVESPQAKLNPTRVDEWLRETQLMNKFAIIRPEFKKLEQAYQDLQQAELRLTALTTSYGLDEKNLLNALEALKIELEHLAIEHKLHEERWSEQREKLNQSLSAANGDVIKWESELNAIEDKQQQYAQLDIDTAKTNLTLLPSWQDEYHDLQGRHQLLTEKHSDIEAAYNQRCNKISEQLERVLERLHDQQQSLYRELEQKNAQKNDELQTLDNHFRALQTEGKQRQQSELHQLELKRAHLESFLGNATFTEEEKSLLNAFDARLKEAGIHQEAAQNKQDRLQNLQQQRHKEREQASEQLRKHAQTVNERQGALDEINSLLYPNEKSLLEFLRREKPGWEQNIGRVIHAELLNRRDLKPRFSELDHDSLFGLVLDQGMIDLPDYAQSEQQLHIRLKQAELGLQEARDLHHEVEKQLGDAHASLEKSEREITLNRSELKQCRDELKRLLDEKERAQHQCKEALATRLSGKRDELELLNRQYDSLKESHRQWLDELSDQALEARMEKNAHWQELITTIEEQLAQLGAEIKSRKQKATQEKKECELWYKRELKSRGVDEDQIIAVKQKMNALHQQIDDAKLKRSLVIEYDHWYEQIWLKQKSNLQNQLTQIKLEASELEQTLNAARHQYSSEAKRISSQQHQQTKAQKETAEHLERVKKLRKIITECQLPHLTTEPTQGTLDERLREGTEQLSSREQQLAAIKQYVDYFGSMFAAQAGSGLFAESWERARERCSSINERGTPILRHRDLVPELAHIINDLMPQQLKGLQELGRDFGMQLKSYYDILADIDRRISSQSARISREVDEELFLDGVSQSAVRIRSRISELEFWPELQSFIDAHRAWEQQGFSDLPDEHYAQSMRRALGAIGQGGLQGGISKLLEIELKLREGSSDLVIRTDRQLMESSSHGMAYLILCKFLLAFTRLLRGKGDVTVHWPIDELGTLHHANVKKIFDACENNNIHVLGAFPNPDSEVLGLFENRYIINKDTRQLQVVKPKINPIEQRLKQRLPQENGQ